MKCVFRGVKITHLKAAKSFASKSGCHQRSKQWIKFSGCLRNLNVPFVFSSVFSSHSCRKTNERGRNTSAFFRWQFTYAAPKRQRVCTTSLQWRFRLRSLNLNRNRNFFLWLQAVFSVTNFNILNWLPFIFKCIHAGNFRSIMTTRCLFVFCLPEQIEEASARLPLVVIYWYRKEEHKPGALNCEKSPRKCTSFRILDVHMKSRPVGIFLKLSI